jgi:hypothetical protein
MTPTVTDRPIWTFDPTFNDRPGYGGDLLEGGRCIAFVSDASVAERIVKAVNAHDDLVAALRAVQKIISEAAMTGFNCHDGDWAERLFFSQQATSAALSKASGS